MAEAHIPEGLTADYANTEVREAILALQQDATLERLAEFLNALREGFLVADVTGTHKKKSTHVRTIRSTKGKMLLPLFTSMDELRLAHPAAQRGQAKGAIMPALEALRLIRSGPLIAVQFDAGSAALIVLRKYIDLVLDDAPIDVSLLESQG